MPVGATIAAAGIGAGATVYGANKANKANKAGLAAATAQQEQVRQDVQPYQQSGLDALGRISNPNELLSKFTESPDYQYRLGRSLDAVTTNKAVNGLLASGSALKGVTGTASNMAGSEFGNWWNRQMGLVNVGANANQTTAGIASNIGNNAIATGESNANSAITTSNALGQFGGSLLTALQDKYGSQQGGASSYDTRTAVSAVDPPF